MFSGISNSTLISSAFSLPVFLATNSIWSSSYSLTFSLFALTYNSTDGPGPVVIPTRSGVDSCLLIATSDKFV